LRVSNRKVVLEKNRLSFDLWIFALEQVRWHYYF
jgi:hypothetical protein